MSLSAFAKGLKTSLASVRACSKLSGSLQPGEAKTPSEARRAKEAKGRSFAKEANWGRIWTSWFHSVPLLG